MITRRSRVSAVSLTWRCEQLLSNWKCRQTSPEPIDLYLLHWPSTHPEMSYTVRTSDLPKLDLDTDRGTDFLAWQQQWLAYRSLSGLSNEPAAKQVQALQLCFSRETLNIVDNLRMTNAQKKDQTQVIAALKQHVEGRINETIERRNLRQRKQLQGESFDDFLFSLRELAKTCNFCNNDCLQKALRDQIIEGLLDGEIIQELLQEKNLTLDQAITKCRGLEAAKKSRSDIQGKSDIYAVQTKSPGITSPPYIGCGNKQHEGGRKNCPAYKRACRRCGKIGHFSLVCRQGRHAAGTKQMMSIPKTNSLRTSGIPFIQLSKATSKQIIPAPTITAQVTTNNGQTSIDILPDSGADICAAGPEFVRKIGEHIDNLAKSDVTPHAVNGSRLHPIRKALTTAPTLTYFDLGKETRLHRCKQIGHRICLVTKSQRQ